MARKLSNYIGSILDTDLYKLSMQYSVIRCFNNHKVRYSLFLRTDVEFPDGFASELRNLVQQMSELKLTDEEYVGLKKKCGRFLPDFYFDFLKGYSFDPSEVGIIQEGNTIKLTIEGYWYRTILWEVPLMAIISQLYFEMSGLKPTFTEKELIQRNIDKNKIFYYNNLFYTDFGTRRRYSLENHDNVVRDLKNSYGNNFLGTSNVYLGLKYNIGIFGTVAHEDIQFHAAYYGFENANKMAFENWTNVFQGDLGTALLDTLTTDVALKSFDMKYSKLYDSVRHDSGDPIQFGNKIIKHYEKYGIDPMSKTIIFSDGLKPEDCVEIGNYFKDRIKVSFGLGTNLTNDVGVKPLNMVIKMTAALINDKWVPTIKLSDVKSKHTGDEKMIKLAKEILNID